MVLQKIKDMLYRPVELKYKWQISKYCKRKCEKAINLDKINNVDVLYIVVAFNNVRLLEYQFKALKKFSEDRWSYLVVDNSTELKQSSMIEQWCFRNDIAYIKLFPNTLKLSFSHACALNWVCTNIIPNLNKVDIVGFLDHDIFPIGIINIKSILENQSIYGAEREGSKGKWYLWAGLFFFRTENISVRNLDFTPGNGMDTGGGVLQNAV